jgi:CubicO group peptidase (beta-lactamase class C family)
MRENWGMAASRPERGSHLPGTHFYYNNWDYNALGSIFRELTGKDIFKEFDERIAGPIGMQDFDPSNCHYSYERENSEHPVYGFRMSARDMTRFGARLDSWRGFRLYVGNDPQEQRSFHDVWRYRALLLRYRRSQPSHSQ